MLDIKLSLVLLGILLIMASISADSTSVYAGQTIEKYIVPSQQVIKGVIPDMPDIPGKWVTATVLDNTDHCLVNCELILNVTSELILIPSDVSASFKDVHGRAQVREYEYEWLATSTRAIECYEDTTEEVNTTVFNNQTQQNETVLINVTTTEQVFCGFEDYTYWESGLPLVDAGESTVIKIKGKKRYDENLDIIPSLYGIQFKEWAWWNSSGTFDHWAETDRGVWLNLSLVTDHTMELEINSSQASDTGNGSLIFPFSDDFNDASIDTNKWTTTGTPTEAGGILTLTGTDGEKIEGKTFVGTNHSIYVRGQMDACTSFSFIGISMAGATKNYLFLTLGGNSNVRNYNGVGQTQTQISNYCNPSAYHRFRIDRNGTTNTIYTYNAAGDIEHIENNHLFSDTATIRAGISTSARTLNLDYAFIAKYDDSATITVTCANITATQHHCNITTDTNLTDYQVLIPYSEVGAIGSNLSVGIAGELGGGNYTINNYTYTTPQYETAGYNYSLNFTANAGNENISVNLEYHDTNISVSCTNMSLVYYCPLDNLEAYPIATNNTVETSTWHIQYDDVTGQHNQTQNFNVNIYDGIWPTNISSEVQVTEQFPTQINVTYGYSPEIQGTISGTAILGSSSGSLTCSDGNCTTTFNAPSVDSFSLYQTEGNLTLTSSYWSETGYKTIRIENNYSMFPASSGSCYLGSSCSNGYDGDWGTAHSMGNNGHINITFNFTELYHLEYWKVKDNDATSNKIAVDDCIGTEVIFKMEEYSSWDAKYYCLNQSSDTFILLGSDASGTHANKFYESQVYYSQNNSLTKVTPFGLTDCSIGESLFNYSCRDEDTQNLITCNYSQTFTIISAVGTTYETFSGEAQEWEVCYYPLGWEANISSIEQYEATDYNTRFYYLFDVATGNTSYNQTIFLVNDVDSKITFIYVKEYGVAVEGAYIYVQKYFVEEGTFKTVAWARSDTEGKGVTYLVPNDEFYRFVVMDNGEIIYTSETMQVGCAASYCSITLNIETSSVEFWDYLNGISSSCSFANATKIISCTFAVNDGTQHKFTFTVYNMTGGKEELFSNSTTTASGTLWYDLGDENTTGTYSYFLISESTPYILQDGMLNLDALASWGKDGIFIAFAIILVLTLALAPAGPIMMVLGTYIGLVISWLLQFIDLGINGPAIIAGLGILVGVLIYGFRR